MDRKEEDICIKLSTYPQFGGTCWFNAILMAIFYSQNSRKLLLKIAHTWDMENKFLKICKHILLKYYIFTDKASQFFNKFKPEVIIFYMLQYFKHNDLNKRIRNSIKKYGYNNLGYFLHYITFFYKCLGIKCLGITYTNYNGDDTYLLNVYKHLNYIIKKGVYEIDTDFSKINVNKEIEDIIDILRDIPDVLIINNNSFNYINNFYYNIVEQTESDFLNITTYGIKSEDIQNLKEYKIEITFNGHKYRLESCLLNSYNSIDENNPSIHTVAGITCKNNRYIYNGWEKTKTEEEETKYGKKAIACPLLKYNWDLNDDDKPFCLNYPACNIINDPAPNPYCFSFGKMINKIAIYIRCDNLEPVVSKDNNNNTNTKSDELKLNSDFALIVKNMHDIKNLSLNEIIKQLHLFNVNISHRELKGKNRKDLEILLYEKISKYFSHKIDRSSSKTDRKRQLRDYSTPRSNSKSDRKVKRQLHNTV